MCLDLATSSLRPRRVSLHPRLASGQDDAAHARKECLAAEQVRRGISTSREVVRDEKTKKKKNKNLGEREGSLQYMPCQNRSATRRLCSSFARPRAVALPCCWISGTGPVVFYGFHAGFQPRAARAPITGPSHQKGRQANTCARQISALYATPGQLPWVVSAFSGCKAGREQGRYANKPDLLCSRDAVVSTACSSRVATLLNVMRHTSAQADASCFPCLPGMTLCAQGRGLKSL